MFHRSQPSKKTMVVAEGVRGRRTPLPREDWRRTDRENGTVGACPEVSQNGNGTVGACPKVSQKKPGRPEK